MSCEFKRDVLDQREHEEHRWFHDTMARVGRLEAQREMTEARTGRSFPRGVGERPRPTRANLSSSKTLYPVDD